MKLLTTGALILKMRISSELIRVLAANYPAVWGVSNEIEPPHYSAVSPLKEPSFLPVLYLNVVLDCL
jgi:hypothetical protein